MYMYKISSEAAKIKDHCLPMGKVEEGMCEDRMNN